MVAWRGRVDIGDQLMGRMNHGRQLAVSWGGGIVDAGGDAR